MRTVSSYRTPALLALGFFVLGLGTWSLYLGSGSLVGPLVLFFGVGLWAGLMEADAVERGERRHPLGAALPLLLGPALLVTADLLGRTASGAVLDLVEVARVGGLIFGAAGVALLVLTNFVAALALGLDRYFAAHG